MASSVIAGTGTAVVGNPVGKSTRRAWWNTYQQRWDGLLSATDGDHFIVEEIDGTANFTTVELEDRGSARPTIYWDNANKKLYVASRHTGASEFWILDYDDSGDEYTFAVGVARTGITIPGINDANGVLSITVTPNGDAWIFLLTTAGLEMQHYDGTSFETGATVIDSNPSAFGCTDCSWFADGGTNFVCVYAAENAGASGDHFFLYIDEDDSSVTTPGNWTDESSSLPGPSGGAEVDDHCCLAKDSDENIYGIYKQEGANDDLRLWKRTPTGTFSGTFQVWAGADGITRPTIGIKKKDSSADEELFASAPQTGIAGDDIWYKISPLDTISFGSGKGTSIINEGTDNFSDSMVWQSDFVADSDSGVLIVATNLTDQTRWKGNLVITGGATAALTGTTVPTITEADIKAGGKTAILTLTGDTFVTGSSSEDGIAGGSDSDKTGANKWDAVVKTALDNTDVVLSVGNTVATITLPAFGTYETDETEVITWTIPAVSLTTSASDVIAEPTFNVTDIPAITGTAVGDLSAVTGSAVGIGSSIIGSASGDLAPITGSASGTVTVSAVTGSANGFLTVVEGSGSGTVIAGPAVGTGVGVLTVVEGNSSGQVDNPVTGTATGQLSAVVGAAFGQSVNDATGTAAGVLAPLTAVSSGSVLNPVTGVATGELKAVIGASIGTVTGDSLWTEQTDIQTIWTKQA